MADPALLGMPLPFEFEGQIYQVSPRTFEVEALFRNWLESEALRAIQRHRDQMAPDEYQRQEAGWRQDCAAGVYAYGTPLSVQAEFSPDGMKYLAYLSLAKASPQVTMHAIDRIWADEQAWARLCEVMGRTNDPNPKTPEPSPPAAP